jgi:hypothetical protein
VHRSLHHDRHRQFVDDRLEFAHRVGARDYSPVKLGVRFSNIAEMPSLRSRDGRKAEFHAAT